MTVTFLFRELIRKPTEEWTRERLILLPVVELSDLCQLAGIRHSGTKQELIERLVDQTEVQRIVRPYWTTMETEVTTSQVQLLANAYKGRELKAMCRRAGCFPPPSKYGMAASLIGWSRACIRRGREVYYRAKEAALNSPTRQLLLKF
ncbi:MAG: SAP domain-containing protein [Gloeocapsa sp. UFS-A4-WI-NPMV-4B04]|jgi:hypothetical protein|nr:SAP domain-containing protein [Gloeocapsa sp. UFS-A4-WI-NPMV-4B04]